MSEHVIMLNYQDLEENAGGVDARKATKPAVTAAGAVVNWRKQTKWDS